SLWRHTVGVSDEDMAEQIRRDGIDILVDLSGHTIGNRLAVFAHKPAPIQVTAWGHAHGTGLPTVDAFFADPVQIPQSERPFYAETVVDLPCFLVYEAPDYAPAVAPLPALATGTVTFGCFNRLDKISPEARALWARVLAAVPGTRLLVKDTQLDSPETRQRFAESLISLGLSGDRLDFLGGSPHHEHLAMFARVDIGLDPFPQTGGISTLEALWLGVPVVTIRGQTPASRNGAAINAALGLNEFIAETPEEYVAIAARTAADLPRLASLRSDLRPRLSASAVGNPALYTRSVETAYRDLWRGWCEREEEGRRKKTQHG
ncbi:MAG: acetylglucosamine transferase, partial [Alphaproteobacteria bacterium]